MKLTLPFYFGATPKHDNAGFPQTFPFNLSFDKALQIYRQRDSKALKTILDEAYLKGAMMAGGMNDAVIGGARVDEVFSFIKDNFVLTKTTNVLELGCGEGQVLRKLAQRGIQCTGLEPGPQVLQIQGKNLSVINDFFPSDKVTEKYNLLLHFGVLEHIADPINFMLEQKKLLKKNGAIIFAVPNCEEDLKAGDISLFLHQHYNYFTRYGIEQLAKTIEMSLEKVIVAKSGGFLYAKLTLDPQQTELNQSPVFSDKQFKQSMKEFNHAVKNFFSDEKQANIAIYCPLRAMNLLSTLAINDCRLVDDNNIMHGRCLPTFNRKIENFSDIVAHPPKKLLIYSRTFGDKIKAKCLQEKKLVHVDIKTVDELL